MSTPRADTDPLVEGQPAHRCEATDPDSESTAEIVRSFLDQSRKILADEPIEVFNQGHHARDFTYIDDIVEGVIRVLDQPAQPNPDWSGDAPDPATSKAPWRVYNIGNNRTVELMDYIAALEKALGRPIERPG